jgi:phosphonate transport system ATP-binding protein
MDFLEKVGLLDKAHEKVGKLSGGEQQRVAIARALVQGAKVIMADEPIKGLDPKSADRVMEDFKSLCKRQELVAICSMQNLDLAERFATRIWGLSKGRIVLDIPARRLTQYEKNLIFSS